MSSEKDCGNSFAEGLKLFSKEINYTFKNTDLIKQALTHSSYANEHKYEGGHNERLEFLGDAVLELVSSEFIFGKNPNMKEGDMSKLRASIVCEPTLAICARKINLDKMILLGKGERVHTGKLRDSITSDALEAVIGAIYLDGGFENAREFIIRFVLSEAKEITLFVDNKTRLQEAVQENNQSPVYTLEKAEGPDHNKMFYMNVSVDGVILGRGIGHSKKAAQQEAAREALIKLGEVTD